MKAKITMHVLAPLSAESDKNVSKKFGFIVSETFVDVETLVFQQKDLWITLWMECMDDSDNVNDVLNSVRRRAIAKVGSNSVPSVLSSDNRQACRPFSLGLVSLLVVLSIVAGRTLSAQYVLVCESIHFAWSHSRC